MARKPLSMRKIKEVLRLKHESGLSQRQIAASLNISHTTVGQYLELVARLGLGWPWPAELDESRWRQLLAQANPSAAAPQQRPLPPMAEVHRQLQAKGVTLQLVWEEYHRDHPDGYGYTQFWQHYRRFRAELDPAMRQIHPPGERMFVDWAGMTMPLTDPTSGAVRSAYLFVATLGTSNYTFARAYEHTRLPAWIEAHVHAWTHFSGVARLTVCDNPKTAVLYPCRYEPELNSAYAELAEHYGTVILPARARKPKDKAKVEAAVGHVERRILAALRDQRFFGLAELNAAIEPLLKQLNERPFQKLPGSRASWFAELEAPALHPLPATAYELASWRQAKANIDYHIQVDWHQYSVPYRLSQQTVEVRLTERTVEVFHQGQRVALHQRSQQRGGFTTDPTHRPKSHQAHLDWTPSRLIDWAQRDVGPQCAATVRHILEHKPHPEMGYRSCLGLIRLGRAQWPRPPRTSLPARPVPAGLLLPEHQIHPRHQDREPTLAGGPRRQHPRARPPQPARRPVLPVTSPTQRTTHMLQQPTRTQLYQLRLLGMAEAYDEQCAQPRSAELSFDERFALLVQRQWHWRHNRALATRLRHARLKHNACLEDLDYSPSRGLKRAVIDQLGSGDWVRHHQNVIITGPTGCGKTFIACALAQKACRDGHRSLYYYLPILLRALQDAHADGSLGALLKKTAKAPVLVIDDWGLAKLDERQGRDLLEILDDRQGRGSTILTSQLPVAAWHQSVADPTVADPTVADAILDRLIHNAHRLELKGESRRRSPVPAATPLPPADAVGLNERQEGRRKTDPSPR